MPVKTARNTMAGPTVFYDPHENVQVEWAGAGDSAGNDVQPVPEAVQKNVNYVRAVRRGILEEISEEEAAAYLDKQTASFQERQVADAAQSRAYLDPAAHNDKLSFQCVGPSASGRGQCSTQVIQREQEVGEVPPLCQVHKNLAQQFIPMPTDKIMDNGKPLMGWTRPTIDR